MKQSAGDHCHMISPTRHNKFLRSPKIARRRQSSNGNWMSWRRVKLMNKEEEVELPQPAAAAAYDYHHDMAHHHHTTNTNSPYYRGLTDQSLAILDHGGVSSSSCSPRPPHPLQFLSSAAGYSPYYKGLTDFSLAIHHDSSWTTHPHHHTHDHHNNSSSITSSSSSHHLSESSPYYRGLIDYSLALALHHPSSFNSPTSSLSSLFRDKITPLPPPPPPTPISTHDPHHVHVAFLTGQDMPVLMETQAANIEGKPALISGTNTVNQSSSEATLEADQIQMDLMTTQHDDDDVKGKPLSVNESEAIPVEITEIGVLEEKNNEEKTISDDGDDVVLVTEDEKPLRERVVSSNLDQGYMVDQSTVVLEEEENADLDLEAEDQMELVIEEEEELTSRERVSEEKEADKVEVLVKEEQNTEFGELKDHSKAVAVPQAASEGNVYNYLWATKYQPNTLAEFICNADKALQLKALVKEGCGCNHFIFDGPPNAGKRSMIRAMLREVFGADRVKVTEEYQHFNLKGEMVDHVQLHIKKSLHHVEVNLSEAKGYEKHVIVELFMETYGKVAINSSLPCSPESCQAIVLYEAEKLSLESLLYIKWLLEKYKGCNKVFFCCSDESRLQPIKSLCTTVRLSSPSTQEIVKILEYIGEEEGIKLSRDSVMKIILRSNNNLRQAIRSLEATCRNKDTLNDSDLILSGWEDDILNIGINIFEEQSPRQLYAIRKKLQSIMAHDVPPDLVYKSLVAALTSLVDDSLRPGVAKLDKEYNRGTEIKFESVKQFSYAQNKQGGSNEKNNEPSKKNEMNYLKVEEFIAKFMSWYKNSCRSNNDVQLEHKMTDCS